MNQSVTAAAPRKVLISTILVVLALLGSAAAGIAGVALAAEVPQGEPILKRCLVSYVDEADVSAWEAGVLVELFVHEGDTVQKGMTIARINDEQPRMEREKAVADLGRARKRADNTVNIRSAEANADVAKTELELKINEATNETTPGTKSASEIRKLQLECKKAELQIEQARLEQEFDQWSAAFKEGEVRASEEAIRRRLIVSPLDGEVRKLDKHVGEWMQPGDRLAHVVRLDTLRVESMIDATQWNPDEMKGREVTVEADLERGRREKFQGRIIFVSGEEQSGGEFLVRAEVTNRRGAATDAGEGGWLLRAGKPVKMTIHTTRPPVKR